MAGDEQHVELLAAEGLRGAFGDHVEVAGLHGLDLPGEAELLEEVLLGHRGHRVRVADDAAAVLAHDPGAVPGVIDVAVGQQEGFHPVAGVGEPLGRLLRGVDENSRVRQKKAVRVKDTAGKSIDRERHRSR